MHMGRGSGSSLQVATSHFSAEELTFRCLLWEHGNLEPSFSALHLIDLASYSGLKELRESYDFPRLGPCDGDQMA